MKKRPDSLKALKKLWFYETDGDTAVITGYKGADTDIAVPDKIGRYSVVKIGFGAFSPHKDYARLYRRTAAKEHYNNIRRVIIPPGVTEIEKNAFSYCASLKEAVLPATLKIIGEAAFRGSTVRTAVIPKGVVEIGADAFADCKFLKDIVIPDGIIKARWAFHGCGIKTLVIPEGVTEIAKEMFIHCESLREVVTPASLRRIGERAFESSGVERVSITEGVTKIDFCAFYDCLALKEVTLPSTLRIIENHVFGRSKEDYYGRKKDVLESVVFAGNSAKAAIGRELFENRGHVVVYAPPGSPAAKYAQKNKVKWQPL